MKQMNQKDNIIRISQGIDYHRLFKNLDEKWLTIHVNEGEYLPS